VIAAALRVPPLQLLFPGEQDDDVDLLPGQRTSTFHAIVWFTGGRGLMWPGREIAELTEKLNRIDDAMANTIASMAGASWPYRHPAPIERCRVRKRMSKAKRKQSEQTAAGRHRIRPTTRAAYEHALAPLRQRHGGLPVQKLTKAHLDELVDDLAAGRCPGQRHKWGANSINPMLNIISAVLAGLVKQGVLVRDVASLVDRMPRPKKNRDPRRR
jgi:hypothetical protein